MAAGEVREAVAIRLRRIRIKNYRSIYDDGDENFTLLEVSPHGNYLVGPNNVGKSNIIRALQLALRPEGRRDYDPEIDIPKQKKWAYPTITLDFQRERKRIPYGTLLRYVDEYEQSVKGAKEETFASQGMVRYHVQYGTEPDSRQEFFQAHGAGSVKGDPDLLEKALNQFHDVIRLVDIESGENLESLLQRGFNELFATVLRERFSDKIDDARDQRTTYESHLREEVLQPVAEHIAEKIPEHVPGVEDVHLSPDLAQVEEALTNVNIEMEDNVETPLAFKGTGVRGALIQMFMSFISEASRRAVVFAIEEPEAFIHPEGHASLGQHLESFTNHSDISLLVTTHSPFILTQESSANVFTVSKKGNGRTTVETSQARRDSIRRARRLLTGSDSTPTAMDLIDTVPDDAEGILVVEGMTDRSYLEIASSTAEQDLLEDIHIIPSQGANEAAKDAVVVDRIFEEGADVHVILDADPEGDKAKHTLTSRLKFQGKREISQYSRWRPKRGRIVEAEDLFPDTFIEEFQDEWGEEAIEGYLERNDGSKHYEITHTAKGDFAAWTKENASKTDWKRWHELLTDVRDELGIEEGG